MTEENKIAKRLFGTLLKVTPSPTLLVSYVGDVHTYEKRATPGDTALSDPGYPFTPNRKAACSSGQKYRA